MLFGNEFASWPVVCATFNRLIAELRRLGACVVFASFQKVIIATNKSDVKAARDYAKFVVSTVTSRDLFNTLQVRKLLLLLLLQACSIRHGRCCSRSCGDVFV